MYSSSYRTAVYEHGQLAEHLILATEPAENSVESRLLETEKARTVLKLYFAQARSALAVPPQAADSLPHFPGGPASPGFLLL